jgi:hypothetical protein
MQLTSSGTTSYVEYLGESISEEPGAVVYNTVSEKITVFGSTDSTEYSSTGGSNFFFFQLDTSG